MNLRMYHEEIKALARLNFCAGRLALPDHSVQLDNPLCGDRVRIDIVVDDHGRVLSLAQETKGCLLCAAASSMVGKNAAGISSGDAERLLDAVTSVLGGRETALDLLNSLDWPEIRAFAPVAEHGSRFDCVLLPFKALLEALRGAHPRHSRPIGAEEEKSKCTTRLAAPNSPDSLPQIEPIELHPWVAVRAGRCQVNPWRA
jgi:nitrogen fixation NifU-like protein